MEELVNEAGLKEQGYLNTISLVFKRRSAVGKAYTSIFEGSNADTRSQIRRSSFRPVDDCSAWG
jgi:hypothetical protein